MSIPATDSNVPSQGTDTTFYTKTCNLFTLVNTKIKSLTSHIFGNNQLDVQVVKERLIYDWNRKNVQTGHEVSEENRSKYSHISEKAAEFLVKYKLPHPDRYDIQDQSFSVRWQIDKANLAHIPMHDFPEGYLVVENLQTGENETSTNIWIAGHYTPGTQMIQDSYRDRREDWWVSVPAQYAPVQNWVNGHWDNSVTKMPIYDKFVGYNVFVLRR